MSGRNCRAGVLVRRAGVGLLGVYFAGACSSDRPDFGQLETVGPDAAVDAGSNDHGSHASVTRDASVSSRDGSESTITNSASTDTAAQSYSTEGSTSAITGSSETRDSSEVDDTGGPSSSDASTSNDPDETSTNEADAAATDGPDESSRNEADASSADDPDGSSTNEADASAPEPDASSTSEPDESSTSEPNESSTSEPDESSTDVTGPTSTDSGSSTDVGCDDNEDCDDPLLCSPNGECVECLTEGDRREGTTACGLNGAGLLEQECEEGFWVDDTECVDPDECENGTSTTCEARFDSLGVCAARTITCTDGSYDASECEGEEELCNPDGLDEDCDGELNEDPCEIYTSLSTADGHVCALTSGERVLCWGSNIFGQTGSSDGANGTTPTAVFGMVEVRSVAVSNTSSCAVFHDDTARCWGSNDNGELGDGTTNTPGAGAIVVVDVVSGIQQMLPGRNRACALLTDGTVECWADDPDPTATTQIGNLSDVVAADVAPEAGRFCALLEGGTVRCWDTFDDSAFAITGVTNAIQVDVGDVEACALLSDGTVSCWTSTSAADVGLTSVVHVDSGRDWSCAVLEDGSVHCWGDFYGTTPVQIDGISNATSVSVGYSYACVIKSDATASCFGKNLQGQLGDPETECCSLDVLETRFPPVLVAGP
jgi:hypothetical protein